MKHLRYGLIAVLVLAFGASGAWAFGSSENCVGCHTTLNPNNDGGALHSAHTAFINGCTYCHTSVGDTPATGSSGQDSENGCSGCHVLGGVNRLHGNNCGCHNGVAPISESDTPPYYGTAATDKRFSCFDGLDNDGDGLTDGADDDCIGVPNSERTWSIIKQIYGDE